MATHGDLQAIATQVPNDLRNATDLIRTAQLVITEMVCDNNNDIVACGPVISAWTDDDDDLRQQR